MNDDSGEPLELAALQRWLQAVITHPGGVEAGELSAASLPERAIDRMILPSRSMSAADRLAVYGNAYYARLLACLRDLLPALHFTLGNDAFDALAFAYLQRHPSTSYSLGHLAQHFVDDLRATRPAHDSAAPIDWTDLVIDLAQLEWTIDEVFDGPGEEEEESRIAERLAAIAADAWPGVRLRVSQSLRLLDLRFPLDAYYASARTGREHELPQPDPCHLVVWRRNYVVRRWAMPREAFVLLRELAGGLPLAQCLENAAADCENFASFAMQVPEWFRDWGKAGLIIDTI